MNLSVPPGIEHARQRLRSPRLMEFVSRPQPNQVEFNHSSVGVHVTSVQGSRKQFVIPRRHPADGKGEIMSKALFFRLTFLAMVVLVAIQAHAQVPGPLKLTQTIPLTGLKDGDFDHFALDAPGQRLFLAAEENSTVVVIDLRTNKVIGKIGGAKAPHSMGYNSDSKKLFVVDDGGPDQVEIFDGTSFKLLGTIPMGAHADVSIYDPASKLYYVGNGGRKAKEDSTMISVVDTATDKKVGDIKIDGDRIESIRLEEKGPRMFVNVYYKGEVAVVDRTKRSVVATWSFAQQGKNFGSMALDEPDHRLFVHARDPGMVLVIDTETGKLVTSLPCQGDYDDAIYDPGTRRLYLIGTPFLKVWQKNEEGDRYDILGQVPTAFHSITGFLVPSLNHLFIAVNHHGNTDAVVQAYDVVP
jgi:YVTN family beta-propeller protein